MKTLRFALAAAVVLELTLVSLDAFAQDSEVVARFAEFSQKLQQCDGPSVTICANQVVLDALEFATKKASEAKTTASVSTVDISVYKVRKCMGGKPAQVLKGLTRKPGNMEFSKCLDTFAQTLGNLADYSGWSLALPDGSCLGLGSVAGVSADDICTNKLKLRD